MQEEILSKKIKITPNEGGEDIISQLPDDTLHEILSLIPFECAAKTRFLSKRWEGLWKLTTSLDFGKDLKREESLYNVAGAINRILLIHGGDTLAIFRLHFPMMDSCLKLETGSNSQWERELKCLILISNPNMVSEVNCPLVSSLAIP